MASSLLFVIINIANLIIDGISHPVGETVNATISREQMDRAGRVPSRSITTSPKSSEWSRSKQSNLSRVIEEPTFVFPEEIPIKPRFLPKIPKRSLACAKGSTFCENIDDYPGDYLQNVLANKGGEFQNFLGVDIITDPAISRKVDGIDENPLCPSMEDIVFPKAAMTKDDKWLYVVNLPPFKQGVRVEKCLKRSNSNSQGCAFTEQFPLGYKTSCVQKHVYRKLLALDEDGKPITDNFPLPSCCACTVTHNSLKTRVGGNNLPMTPAITAKPKGEK